jgi:HNH endonuclease
MNGSNIFLVVLPEDDFRCVLSTGDLEKARGAAPRLGGLVAIVPVSWALGALASFAKLHGERSAGALIRSEWRQSRLEINPRCDYCTRILTVAAATIDHAVPISRGGIDAPENWLLACRRCNQAKGEDTIDEYRGRLLSGILFNTTEVETAMTVGLARRTVPV